MQRRSMYGVPVGAYHSLPVCAPGANDSGSWLTAIFLWTKRSVSFPNERLTIITSRASHVSTRAGIKAELVAALDLWTQHTIDMPWLL